MIKLDDMEWAMMVHAFDPSSREQRQIDRSLSLKLAWFTEWISEQPGPQRNLVVGVGSEGVGET